MARKYETTEIDGVNYELHGVKADDKKIGFVPVRLFAGPDDFREYIIGLTDGEMELAIADWKYGNGVRLQRMARDAVGVEGPPKDGSPQFAKLANKVPKEIYMQYHGDHAGFVKYVQTEMYEPADVETDEDHIWEELL